jgi:fumarate hydratase class I
MENFYESMYQLIVETSTNLPKDVRRAIAAAKLKESAGTRSAMSLATITNNMKIFHQFAKIQAYQHLN